MSHPLRTTVVSLIGSTLLVTALGLAPAAADAETREPSWNAPPPQAQSDHDGDADADSSTAYTEDNDTNDGGTANNVPDSQNDHPSGKDRSVENGKSGNQGKAESDPDDDGRGPERSNGGPDKPNGAGGVDEADQDGNNGCGNDDDFEDDNEGWCGPKPAETPAAAAVVPAEEQQPCPDGSMARPCATKLTTSALATTTENETEQACPDGAMTRPCSDATPVATVTFEVGCSTADRCAEDAPAVVRTPVRGGIAEDDAVVAAPGSVQSAGTLTPVSTVSARSGGAAVLAAIPVLGDIIEGELPMTGGNIATLVALAGALLASGTLLVRGSRRKAATAS